MATTIDRASLGLYQWQQDALQAWRAAGRRGVGQAVTGAGKTRVGIFPLPGRSCGDIGRIVVNDVAECSAEDGADLRDTCLGGLATQSRTDIDFGL